MVTRRRRVHRLGSAVRRLALSAGTLAMVVGVAPVRGEVTLPSVFGDHMVLQGGVRVPVWGKASPGEAVRVEVGSGPATTATTASTVASPDGRWKVFLGPLPTGAPLTLTVRGRTADGTESTLTRTDVLVGEVWLASGQSNMDFRVARTDTRTWCGVEDQAGVIAAADHPKLRMFIAEFALRDEPQDDVKGRWLVCSPETAGEFSAVGYYFALELQKKLDRPIGIVLTSYGASTAQAWISADRLKAHPQLASMLDDYAKACADWASGASEARYKSALAEWEAAAEKAKAAGKNVPRKPGAPRNPHEDQHNPALLYNGMVAPLVPYAMKGVTWYQGESNGYNSALYLELMKTLIADWRRAWSEGSKGAGAEGSTPTEFPFLSVQLAGYRAPASQPVENSQIANVRDAQLKSLAVPNTALATAVDVGDAQNVHPKNKAEVGRRLSLAALRLAYGQETPHAGPTVASVTREGSRLRVTFENTFGGLVFKGGAATGFALRDEAGKWHAASATVEGDSVLLSAPEVPEPKEARYAWANNPPISLYGRSGLPAYPFRTDP